MSSEFHWPLAYRFSASAEYGNTVGNTGIREYGDTLLNPQLKL